MANMSWKTCFAIEQMQYNPIHVVSYHLILTDTLVQASILSHYSENFSRVLDSPDTQFQFC